MLPLGKASELAEMSRMELGLVLGRRGIPRHYGEDDLKEDLRYAGGE
jgi:predicted HTH domain antitoxin